MKKRFTDCDIWDDPWFRKLPNLYKAFWRFLCDKCDPAGVWKIDYEGAGFFLGEQISEKNALDMFNSGKKRIHPLSEENWLIIGFILFQYGELSPNCPAHKPVYASISRHGLDRVLKGYSKGINTLLDKDKDKDSPSSLSSKESIFALPDWVDSVTWDAYLDIRKRKKAASTVHALNLILATLSKLKAQGQDPKAILEKSIMSGWTGVFPLREDFNKPITKGNGAAPIPGKYDNLKTIVCDGGIK